MVQIAFFLILLFSGFQLYALWPGKVFVISLEAVRQLLFLYLFALIVAKLPKIELKRYEKHTAIVFAALIALLFVHIFRSPAIFNGMTDVVKLSYVFFAFLIATQLISIHGVVRVGVIMRKCLLFVSVIFLLQVCLWILSGYYVSGDTGEFSIGLKNTLAVGSMLSSILAVYFYNNYLEEGGVIDLIVFVTFFVLTFLSFTRIAILGMLSGFLFLTLFHRRYRLLLLAALVLAPILVVFSKSIIAETFKGDIGGLQEIAALHPVEIVQRIELRGRSTFWPIALKIFWKKPLIGNGLGYSNQVVKEATGYYEHVHNDYLKLLADTGLTGLAWYVALLFLMLYHGLKIYRSNAATRFHFSLFAATMIQILIFSFTDNVIAYSPYLVVYLFISYALLVRSQGEMLSGPSIPGADGVPERA